MKKIFVMTMMAVMMAVIAFGVEMRAQVPAAQGNVATSETIVNSATQIPQSDGYTAHYSNNIYNATPAGNNQSYFATFEREAINGKGYDLGNNGTSAQGWSNGGVDGRDFSVYARGIDAIYTGKMWKYAKGDTVSYDSYLYTYGGETTASDEGIVNMEVQNQQLDYTAGKIIDGASTGSGEITTTLTHGSVFNDGAILIDATHAGSNVTLTTKWMQDRGMNSMYYDVSGGSLPVSSAWGNIDPASCRNNGNGQWEQYVATTCNVKLGTAPASPGSFSTGPIFLSGQFQEEAEITQVGAAANGVQSITFNTRYAWDNAHGNTNAAIVMQGGVGGQAMVQSSTLQSWPIAYFVVGATSPTRVYVSNCVFGICNGLNSSNMLPQGASVTLFSSAEIIGTGNGQNNIAELATNHIPFATGDQVISTPAAEYHQIGARFLLSQRTPSTGGTMSARGSAGVVVNDVGLSPIDAVVMGTNHHDASAAGLAGMELTGAYQYGMALFYRPTKALLYVLGDDSPGASGPYLLFQDNKISGGNLSINPAAGELAWGNQFRTAGLAVGTVTSVGQQKTDGKLGVAPVVASPARINNQSGSMPAMDLQCGGAVCPAGMYRVTMYANVSSSSGGWLTLNCGWNDGSGAQNDSSAAGVASTHGYVSKVCNLYSNGAENITVSTTVQRGNVQYGLSVVMEKLN